MEFGIKRTYFKEGTNGTLFLNDHFLGFTIELPWLKNVKCRSCIPEGMYFLKPRYSKKHGAHIQVLDVPGRSLILFHLANWANRDLKGCIGPVSQLSGIGCGWNSKELLTKMVSSVYQAQDRNEQITLNIRS